MHSYLEQVQTRVPETRVKVAPYIETHVRPLMRGEDLVTTTDEDDE